MSTLAVLRGIIESQMDISFTGDTTPTTTSVTDYINKSILKIARDIKPQEFKNATPIDHSITSGTNTVTLNASILYPEIIYYFSSTGTGRQLIHRSLQQLIVLEGSNNFFNSANKGDPSYFAIRGNSIITNKYFTHTSSTGIKIYSIDVPTTLASDSDTTTLPDSYDFLIAYMASALAYQAIDDQDNQMKFDILARRERSEINVDLDFNDSDIIQMDPSVFRVSGRDFRDPSVLFGGN